MQIGGAIGGYFCRGEIAEIVGFKRALTDSEMLQIEQYMTVKYGIGTL